MMYVDDIPTTLELNSKLDAILFTLNEAHAKLDHYPDPNSELIDHAFNAIEAAVQLIEEYKSLDPEERSRS